MAKPDIEALVEQTTEVGQLKRDLRTEKAKSELLAGQVADLQKALNVLEAIDNANPSPPKWMVRRKKASGGATFGLFITDTHFDEVVRPEETGGLNRYDRGILGPRDLPLGPGRRRAITVVAANVG